ncbi:MAG: putative oxidoreductase [Acidimicrobiaceae bacterium]|nr:putative oxidoreductase [Acidimicrobiaceae bacterium]
MTRSFDGTVVDEAWLDRLCATALWAPTAGNSAGVRFYTLGAPFVDEYLARATDLEWRERSRRYEGLRRAGAVVLVTARVGEYLRRYSEKDKTDSTLSEVSAWPLPYWHTDAAMATMALLLLLEESGWQAALWGNFRHGDALLEWLKVRDEELFATIFVGRGDENDPPSPSLTRPVPSRQARVTRLTPALDSPS